ncbi:hypothetical protein GCM10009681_12970 [Luedemannella helvata]|uniref:DUF2567 domain-containing protein n=1 Tax=Luedemannella helvata TaxID=349315 RepID=A0ABN2JYC0_9ACTN
MAWPGGGPGYDPAAWGYGQPPPAAPRSNLLGDVLVGVLTAVVVAALGAPLGWLWAALAPRIPIVRVDGGFTYADAEPEQVVAADGWFMLLGAGAGILFAVVAWMLLKRWRGPFIVIGLVLGSLGGAWLAWWAGRQVGLAEFERLRETATVGTQLLAPLGLRATDFAAAHPWTPKLTGVLAVQALAAAFVYTCCAGWSRFASLRGPDPEPTYPSYPAYQMPPATDDQFGPGRTGSSDTGTGTART